MTVHIYPYLNFCVLTGMVSERSAQGNGSKETSLFVLVISAVRIMK